MFGPCITLHPNLAASKGFWPPCSIKDPPKNTTLQIFKKDFVSPKVSTKYISVFLSIFILFKLCRCTFSPNFSISSLISTDL